MRLEKHGHLSALITYSFCPDIAVARIGTAYFKRLSRAMSHNARNPVHSKIINILQPKSVSIDNVDFI